MSMVPSLPCFSVKSIIAWVTVIVSPGRTGQEVLPFAAPIETPGEGHLELFEVVGDAHAEEGGGYHAVIAAPAGVGVPNGLREPLNVALFYVI